MASISLESLPQVILQTNHASCGGQGCVVELATLSWVVEDITVGEVGSI